MLILVYTHICKSSAVNNCQ